MNRKQRRRARALNGSGLVTPTGAPVASVERRAFDSLVQLLRMAQRELAREGVDIRQLFASSPPRGWHYPTITGGVMVLPLAGGAP